MEQVIGDQGARGAARFDTMRQAMVTGQLRTTAVSDTRVVAAMARVGREAFVPAERRDAAYSDIAVPLGRGRELNPPMATGKLLTEAYLRGGDRVLLIGAATGYSAAVLAGIVAEVVAVEVDPLLAELARASLAGVAGVSVIEGPLEAGCPERAPFDVLVVDGAVEALPPALIAQVAIGGRVVTGIDDRGVTRLASGARSAHGFGLFPFADIECVRLPGFARPRPFRF